MPVNCNKQQCGHRGGRKYGIWGGIDRGNPNGGGGRFGSKGGTEGEKIGLYGEKEGGWIGGKNGGATGGGRVNVGG